MRVTVSEKGQVTIPKKLRDSLGIEPGQELDFHEEDGKLVARKAGQEDYLERVRTIAGTLKLEAGVDEFIEDIRGSVDLP